MTDDKAAHGWCDDGRYRPRNGQFELFGQLAAEAFGVLGVRKYEGALKVFGGV